MQDSFSNKLVDYVRSGKPILFYGDKTIPTAKAIEQYNLGICVNTKKDLLSILSNHNLFARRIDRLSEARKQQDFTPRRFLDTRLNLFKRFKDQLKNTEKQSEQIARYDKQPRVASINEKILIKQIIFDQAMEKESLTTTLMNVMFSNKRNLAERFHEF